MSWGGRRLGAGRPTPEKRVQIWPTVKKTTAKKLGKIAFNKNIPIGEVIDKMVDTKDENLVDIKPKTK